MGTVHNINGKYLYQHQSLAQLAHTVDAIATEIDAKTYIEKGMSDDSLITGIPLWQLLDTFSYTIVRATFQHYRTVPFDSAEKYYPLSILSMIHYGKGQSEAAKHKDLYPNDTDKFYSIDATLMMIAMNRKIPLYGLETSADKHRILYKEFPLAQQAEYLVYNLILEANDSLYYLPDTCFMHQKLDCMCSAEAGMRPLINAGMSIC